ncbi:UPF0046 protein C25E10.12-like isoform X1 [Haliotis cracherodii]|uniref:UPF0046 protein C25E10.12-like isoform X1 n=1 Tax=Haliotis cracherodii TaxID=6455 RepID=UPI0039E7F29B
MIKRIKQNIFAKYHDRDDESSYQTRPMKIPVHPLTLSPSKAWKQLKTERRVEKLKPLFPYPPIQKDCIRFVCIGDTHVRHEERHSDLSAVIPPGDVLLHVGDFTMYGNTEEVEIFNQYYGSLPHKVKLLIAGNHDGCLDPVSSSAETVQKSRDLLTNFTFLQDAMVEVYGIKIYGAPWVPKNGLCQSNAFTLFRGIPLLRRWNLIPEDTDILMTHGPPVGYGDTLHNGRPAGCVDLLNTVWNRVRPKYHVFGHIHEGYGAYTDGQTEFINAAMCTKGYRPIQNPIIFDFPVPKGHSKDELVDLSVIEMVLPIPPHESEETAEGDKLTEGKVAEERQDGNNKVTEVMLDNKKPAEVRRDDNHKAAYFMAYTQRLHEEQLLEADE